MEGKRVVSFEIQRSIQQWVNEEDRWNQLCEHGTIYKIYEVSSQIGIETRAFISGLKEGIFVTGQPFMKLRVDVMLSCILLQSLGILLATVWTHSQLK